MFCVDLLSCWRAAVGSLHEDPGEQKNKTGQCICVFKVWLTYNTDLCI